MSKQYKLSGNNEMRARWAGEALAAFANCTDQTLRNKTERAEVMADLLCDLRHYAEQAGIDFAEVERCARMHYRDEAKGKEF